MSERLRVVFFGAGAFGVPTLEALHREHQVAAVVTQPDRPAGRGRSRTPTDVARTAMDRLADVPLIRSENVNTPEAIEQLRSFAADAWVVIAFGQKLSPELLAGQNAMNLHASRLPRWRGAAPIQRAVMSGDAETGNSVITLADRMDAGLVLGISRRVIEPGVTAGELHDLLSNDGPSLVLETLSRQAAGTLSPQTQDESLVTHAAKLRRSDGWVDWTRPADECRARINGMSPWPGVRAVIAGRSFKFTRAVPQDGASPTQQPGVLVDPRAGVVSCGDGLVRLAEVQPDGKRAMAWDAMVRGWPDVIDRDTPARVECPELPGDGKGASA